MRVTWRAGAQRRTAEPLARLACGGYRGGFGVGVATAATATAPHRPRIMDQAPGPGTVRPDTKGRVQLSEIVRIAQAILDMPNVINSTGLVLDIFGVLLLFSGGPPWGSFDQVGRRSNMGLGPLSCWFRPPDSEQPHCVSEESFLRPKGNLSALISARQKTPLRAETCDKSAIPRA